MRKRTMAGLLAAAVTALFAAACGTSSPAGPASAGDQGGGNAAAEGGAKPRGAPQCPDGSVVGPPLGMTLKAPETTTVSLSTVCSYDGQLVADSAPGAVTLRLQIGTDASDFADMRKGLADQTYTLVDRPGVGDQAYSFEMQGYKHTIVTLVARKGDLSVYVGAPSTLDQEIALAGVLFAH